MLLPETLFTKINSKESDLTLWILRNSYEQKDDILGEYSPLIRVVRINKFKSSDFKSSIADTKNAVENKDLTPILPLANVLCHEITHFIDHIATVWGLNSNITILEAIKAIGSRAESEYFKIAKLYSQYQREALNTFYTERFPQNQIIMDRETRYQTIHQNRWKYGYYIGYEYDAAGKLNKKSPILFTKFFNPHTGKPIARVPFTIDALLELNAVNAEMQNYKLQIAIQEEHNVKAEVEEAGKDFLERLYTVRLVLYSVGVHHFSNSRKLGDIFSSFQYGSYLATLSLNLTEAQIASIKIIASGDDEFDDRAAELLSIGDRPTAFYFLCKHSSEIPFPKNGEDESWVNDVLCKAGLKSLREVKDGINIEIKKLLDIFDKIDVNTFGNVKYAKYAKHIPTITKYYLEKQSYWNRSTFTWLNFEDSIFHLPPIIFKDNYAFNPSSIDLDWLINVKNILWRSVLEFKEACRFVY